MQLAFRWFRDDPAGSGWSELFRRTWPSYRAWFLRAGNGARPDFAACRAALHRYLPELVPAWERLVDLAEGDETAARMLSLFCPPPVIAGCTQVALTRGTTALVRNYDYHPELCEGAFILSHGRGTRILASSDCLWGVLDGMNDRGLAVALAFGGRRVTGQGFAISLILRYVLTLCATVQEAVATLERVPSHMSYNVSLVDATGAQAVVEVAPDRPARVTGSPIATNHQRDTVEWMRYERLSRSRERSSFLGERLSGNDDSLEELTAAFLAPPLFRRNYARACGTLYTAVYRPEENAVTYHWPTHEVTQTFDAFHEHTVEIAFDPKGP